MKNTTNVVENEQLNPGWHYPKKTFSPRSLEKTYNNFSSSGNFYTAINTSKLKSKKHRILKECHNLFNPSEFLMLSDDEKIRLMFFAKLPIESEVHNLEIPYSTNDLLNLETNLAENLANLIDELIGIQDNIEFTNCRNNKLSKKDKLQYEYNLYCNAFSIPIKSLVDTILLLDKVARRNFDNFRGRIVKIDVFKELCNVQPSDSLFKDYARVYNPVHIEKNSKQPLHKFYSNQINNIQDNILRGVAKNNFQELNLNFILENLESGMFTNLISCFNVLDLNRSSLTPNLATTIMCRGLDTEYEYTLNSIAQYVLFRGGHKDQLNQIKNLPTDGKILLGNRPFSYWSSLIERQDSKGASAITLN